MNQDIDLKKVELKTYLKFHEDGIWDLFAGLALLVVAVDAYFTGTGSSMAVVFGALFLAPLTKKLITQPRLGYVKFSPERESKEKQKMSALLGLLTFTALLGAVVMMGYTGDAGWQRWIRSLGILPFGMVLALVSGAVGFLYGVKRCLVYAGLILVVFIVAHVYQLRPTVHFGVLGTVLTLTGLVLLIRFIRRYPRAERGQADGI